MTKERELLERALDAWDDDSTCVMDVMMDEIREYFANKEGKQEEEPVCKRCNAYKGLVKALEEQLSNHREKADKYREAVCTLESEKEANSVLTEELNKVLNPLGQEPVAWRLHVEERLLTWKQRFINKSGDQLSLCDFMDQRSIDDLLDYVLDQYALLHPSPQAKQRKPLSEEEIEYYLEVDVDQDYTDFEVGFARGVRWAEKMHGIGGGDD